MKMIKVKNEADIAVIYIHGTIIDDEDSSWIKFWDVEPAGYQWPKEIRSQLDAVKDKPLTIYINSYGGSVAAGVAMANMIARHSKPTTAIVDGYCCSIATQIFFSADTCKMPKNAYLMLHKPSTIAAGDADDFRKAADILDVIQHGLETTYQKKKLANVTNEEITEMMNQETWLTGEEAIQYFNIEPLDSVKTVNCVGSRDKLKTLNYKKIPETLKFKDDGDKNSPSFLVQDNCKKQKFDNSIKEIEIALAKSLAITI